MAIVGLFSLLLLFFAGLTVSTHLWWGDTFATWWRASGSAFAADLSASVERRWNRAMDAFAGTNVAASRLERFAQGQADAEVPSINPFGDASELPRRSLRALANRPAGGVETTNAEPSVVPTLTPAPVPARTPTPIPTSDPAPAEGSDWALVKIDSAMTARILGATARTGDVWVNLTRAGNWESRRERRAFLIAEVRLHPEWTDEDVYDVGLAIGLWEDDSAFSSHRSRNRQRVRRLRVAARRNATRFAA